MKTDAHREKKSTQTPRTHNDENGLESLVTTGRVDGKRVRGKQGPGQLVM